MLLYLGLRQTTIFLIDEKECTLHVVHIVFVHLRISQVKDFNFKSRHHVPFQDQINRRQVWIQDYGARSIRYSNLNGPRQKHILGPSCDPNTFIFKLNILNIEKFLNMLATIIYVIVFELFVYWIYETKQEKQTDQFYCRSHDIIA